MDLGVLLSHITAEHSWPVVIEPDGDYRIEIPTESGRSQVVQITEGKDPDGRPMAWIWSVVADVSAVNDPWYLLKQNAELPYGALSVKGEQVLFAETQLIETADQEELMRALYYVAVYADRYEKLAYGAQSDSH